MGSISTRLGPATVFPYRSDSLDLVPAKHPGMRDQTTSLAVMGVIRSGTGRSLSWSTEGPSSGRLRWQYTITHEIPDFIHDTLDCPMRASQTLMQEKRTMAVRLQTLRSQRTQGWLGTLLGALIECLGSSSLRRQRMSPF